MPDEPKPTLPPIGTVGRIVNPNKAHDWGREYRVVSYNPGNPVTLRCESLERLRRWQEPRPTDPGGWQTIDAIPAYTAPGIPIDWFHPNPKPQATKTSA